MTSQEAISLSTRLYESPPTRPAINYAIESLHSTNEEFFYSGQANRSPATLDDRNPVTFDDRSRNAAEPDATPNDGNVASLDERNSTIAFCRNAATLYDGNVATLDDRNSPSHYDRSSATLDEFVDNVSNGKAFMQYEVSLELEVSDRYPLLAIYPL